MSPPAASSSSSSKSPWADPPSTSPSPSSPGGPVRRYLCILPDFSSSPSETLSRRLSVRQEHLEGAQAGKKVGRIELGGGLLHKDWSELEKGKAEGVANALGGSCLVIVADSIEDARRRLEQDPYATANVWDMSKAQIYPFLQASLVAK